MTLDRLVTALSAVAPFAQDAWIDEKASMVGDYGVVELEGSPSSIWGDDVLVEQFFTVNVVLYVGTAETTKPEAVQGVFAALDLSYRLEKVELLVNPELKRWTWVVSTDGVM